MRLLLGIVAIGLVACGSSPPAPAAPADEPVRVWNNFPHSLVVSVDQSATRVSPCRMLDTRAWHGGAGRLIVTADTGKRLTEQAVQLGVRAPGPVGGTPYAEVDIVIGGDGAVSTGLYKGGPEGPVPPSIECAQWLESHRATPSP